MRSNIILSMLAVSGLSFGVIPQAPYAEPVNADGESSTVADPVQEIVDQHKSLTSRLKDWIVGELGEVYDEGKQLISELESFFDDKALGSVVDDTNGQPVVIVNTPVPPPVDAQQPINAASVGLNADGTVTTTTVQGAGTGLEAEPQPVQGTTPA